jgi:Family of unknown function (DUF6011)
MSRYRWVYHADGTTKLHDVGIWPDGTLYNPNGYPDEAVRAAVFVADQRRHERRSRAAKEAAQTRRRRRARKIQAIAKKGADKVGPRSHCYICGRHLDDLQSIARGIGPECWQDFLQFVEDEDARAVVDRVIAEPAP